MRSRPSVHRRCALILLALLMMLAGCKTQTSAIDAYPWRTLDGRPPVIIAHRGDSGAYPEHTLAAYRSALQIGADLIEPDIVLTQDGVPVCRHDLYLSTTTDVADRPEFADRKRTLGSREDWYVMDFTLAELRTLRAVQPFAERDDSHNGKYRVPTLEELVRLVDQWQRNSRRKVGLFIEIKQPAAHREAGLDASKATLAVLENYRQAYGRLPTFLFQCFDRAEVERLARMTPHPVAWLSSQAVDLNDLPAGCAGLGLNKSLISFENGRSTLIDAAHARGLQVHCWTYRDDQMPDNLAGNSPTAEIARVLAAGADGVFTDFPSTGVTAREALVEEWHDARTDRGDQPLSVRIRETSPRRYIND